MIRSFFLLLILAIPEVYQLTGRFPCDVFVPFWGFGFFNLQ
jgi:hypothetical protein